MKLKTLTILALSLLLLQTSKAQKVLTLNVGHSEEVTSLEFSPDGKYILSGSNDNTVKLWNSKTGQEIRTFKGHTKEIASAVFSPDGKYIISGGDAVKIKLWDVQTGQKIKTFDGQNGMINSLAFSPDGNYILSGGFMFIELWNIQTGQIIHSFNGDKRSVNSVAFSPDGNYIISGGDDRKIKLWDIETGQKIRTFKGHTKEVTSVAFSFNGKYIISGSYDKTIKLWNTQTGQKIQTFKGHTEKVISVAFSHDAKHIISGSTDTIVKLWDSQTGKNTLNFNGSTAKKDKGSYFAVAKTGNSVTFSPDGKSIIAGGDDGAIRLWSIQTGEEIKTFDGNVSPVFSATLSSDAKYILSGSYSAIKLWNLKTRTEITTIKEHLKTILVTAFSPDGKYILSGDYYTGLKLLDIQTMQEIELDKYRIFSILESVAFSPDSKYAIAGTVTGTIIVWDIQNKKRRSFYGHTKKVNSLAFSPDGKYILSGSDDYSLKLWDVQSGQQIRTFECESFVHSVAFSPDGKYIISDGGLFRILLFDVQTGEKIRTFKDKGYRNNLAFSPDGKYIIVGGSNQIIKLLDVQTGKEIRTFKGHTDDISSLSFSLDGKYILSGSYDGSLKLWNVNNGELVITLYGLKNGNDWVAYTPDGKFEGTEKGMELLYYVENTDIIPLSSLYEQFYTPNLMERILSGEQFNENDININDIKLPPLVEITTPESNSKLHKKELSVTIKATDQGGGIDEIRLYLNGKLVETSQRGLKPMEEANSTKTQSFTITLTNGENVLKATAFSNQRTESVPEEISVFYEGVKKTANLYMLVIGVDNYKNPKYKLNYALADANAFKKEVEKGSQAIFSNINIVYLKDAQVTKSRILQEFTKLKTKATEEDVFIFYYAGHGVMSEEDKAQFYIVPYDVTQLYGNNDLLKLKAISANELQNFARELRAQKQMFVLDACQSGGIVEMLASRGAAEEKAISQLARSTGTFWLTASGSEQFATEFKELGHGVFTYAVLLGMQGQADSGSKDKKITVKELSAFLNDKVPELSEKYKGQAQYPTSYGFGQDFPIIIVK